MIEVAVLAGAYAQSSGQRHWDAVPPRHLSAERRAAANSGARKGSRRGLGPLASAHHYHD